MPARSCGKGCGWSSSGEAAEAGKLRLLREAVQAGFDDVAVGRYIDITNEEDEKAFWAGVSSEVDARLSKRGK